MLKNLDSLSFLLLDRYFLLILFFFGRGFFPYSSFYLAVGIFVLHGRIFSLQTLSRLRNAWTPSADRLTLFAKYNRLRDFHSAGLMIPSKPKG
jgi:hypothetical protein